MTAAKPRVLFVDDEPQCLQTLKYVMQDEFDPVLASSADEALRMLNAPPAGPPIEAVVSDLRMPDMSGADLCERIAFLADAPATLFYTAWPGELGNESRERGDVIEKPGNTKTLRERLRMAIQSRREASMPINGHATPETVYRVSQKRRERCTLLTEAFASSIRGPEPAKG